MKNILVMALAPLVASAAIERADVVVVGGTAAGVEAALAAKVAGTKVALFESRPALGGDTAGKLLLPVKNGKVATPLSLRKELDRRLLEARVDFRTWTYVKDVVRDAEGRVTGVNLVNRSGERFLPAKCVVDATERAYLAKAAGGEFKAFPAGRYTVRRRVVSGEMPSGEGLSAKMIAPMGKIPLGRVRFPNTDANMKNLEGSLYECEFTFDFKDGSAWEFARLEQRARNLTWTKSNFDGADTCIFSAPDRLVKDAPGVFTCGPLSDLSPSAAGQYAAKYATSAKPQTSNVKPQTTNLSNPSNLSNSSNPSFDCAIAGLGTGGGPAAISAARAGLSVAAFEYSYHCGGVSTEGQIGNYWFGNRVGFTAEFDQAIKSFGVVQSKCRDEWLRRSAVEKGATLVYGAFVYGVEREGRNLAAFKVMLADGAPAIVRAKSFVDATGNCDVAVAAGEETEFINDQELSLQGAAFMRKKLGASYLNLDWTFVNDCDAEDLWYISLRGRLSYEDGWWDQAQVVDSRERRRLHGLFRVTPQDVMLKRTYPDIVCITRSNFDTHGQTIDPQFLVKSTEERPLTVNLPLRAILPCKTDNLAVIGLGLSASRDAMPILRMVPDVQNQGWVAGQLCGAAVKGKTAFKDVDVRALQKGLVEKGVLPEWVLTAEDSMPVSNERLAAAVKLLPDEYKGMPEVFSDPARSVPLMEAEYAVAEGYAKLKYAHVMGMLGSKAGEKSLVAELSNVEWDKGWNYRGMGQFGRPVSLLDSYIIALARSKSMAAYDAVSALAAKLEDSSHYSHFRAVALYFEAIGDRRAVPLLAKLLSMPGIGGNAFSWERNGVSPIVDYDKDNFELKDDPRCRGAAGITDGERSCCLRELCLARALYRLGDCEGLAEKILKAYAADPRRAYAEHAAKVLGIGK